MPARYDDELDRLERIDDGREQGPPAAPADSDEVERLAEAMLSTLAVVEDRDSFFNPDDLPGGRWAFAGAIAGAVALVLLVLGFLVGHFVT